MSADKADRKPRSHNGTTGISEVPRHITEGTGPEVGRTRQTINGLCTGARKMDDLTLRNAAKIGDVLNVTDLRDFLDN